MFVIYGWRNNISFNLGMAEKRKCGACSESGDWVLFKISDYFTLFFIPIFPIYKEYEMVCPFCQNKINIERRDVKSYKSLVRINSKYAKKRISITERDILINKINKEISQRNDEIRAKIVQESSKWQSKVQNKTDEELLDIIDTELEYNPAFIEAARSELNKRRA